MNLSINLIVRNEEKQLAVLLPLLRNQLPGAEIVIIDQESADSTRDVAGPFADKLIVDKATGNADTSRLLCMNNSSRDWILTLDADEFVTSRFAKDIPSLIEQSYDGYLIHLGNLRYEANHEEILTYGDSIRGEHDSFPCRYRLYRKGRVVIPGELHTGVNMPHLAVVQYLLYNAIIQYKTDAEQTIDTERYAAVSNGTYNKDLHP